MSDAEGTSSKIPATELRDTLDLGKGTLRKRVERGTIADEYYTYQRTPGRGRSRLVIDPRGLPAQYLEQWVEQRIESGELPTPSEGEALSHEWKTAADWRKAEAHKRRRFLEAVPAELTTEAKEDAIETYAAETPDDEQPGGVSMTSWYRYRSAFEDGLAGLMPNPRPSRGTKISETDYERFKDLYLTRDRRSARQCWRRVFGAAKEEGRDVDDFPVAQTFLNQIQKREGEDIITYMREGKDAYYQKKSSYLQRDWDTVAAGDVWFSDHRLFDVFVLDTSTGEVGRPWFTPWMDARSTKMLSWDVYMEHPNSDRIHLAFKRAIEDFGVPKAAYIDNGKDYRALDFAGGRKNRKKTAPEMDEMDSRVVMDLLNVDVTFARPYNARAKTIERKFQLFVEQLEKFSRGYAGADAERRPEITERRRKASVRHPEAAEEMDFLCTLEEFRERVAEWVDRIDRMTSDGRILDGHSPNEIFHSEREEVRHIDEKHLGILCLRSSSERQIQRCQWYDAELDIYYDADWMYDDYTMNGTKAFARRDPQNPEVAWIFRAEDGSLINRATRKKKVHPLASTLGDEEDQEELERQLKREREYVNGLEEKAEEIRQNQPSEEELDRWMEAYVEDQEERRREEGDYKEPTEPEHKTAEAQQTSEEWLEQAESYEAAGTEEAPYDPKDSSDDTDGVDPDDIRIWPDE